MSAAELQTPLEELQRENEVTQKLLERLLEDASLLRANKDILPGEIAEELCLLEQYEAAHFRRFDEDLQPEARTVAMTECFAHLDKMTRDHSEAMHRNVQAREALRAYEANDDGARIRLADALESLAGKDYEGINFEGDYPLSCLLTVLPDDASQRVSAKFSATHLQLEDLDRHIEHLLESPPGEMGQPVRVHCSHPGCTATSEARAVPRHGGQLGIVAPKGGWTSVPKDPEFKSEGTVHLEIGFRCPAHVKASPGEDLSALALARWADEGGCMLPSPIGVVPAIRPKPRVP